MTAPESMDMDPSEVRKRILEDHQALRGRLVEIEAAIAALGDEPTRADAATVATLREVGRATLEELLVHVDLEDRILAPALRETDAFGPVRADGMIAGHRKQREMWRQTLDRLATGSESTRGLVATMRELISELRDDMETEESELLDPTLLKDDLVNISFIG